MRIWLKDSERKADPEPLLTDDRKAMLVGMALWIVALAALLLFIGPLTAAGNAWWMWTCVAGLALGVIGLIYAHWRQK